MGQNLDTDSIFGSYLNNVLLKEETGQPLSQEENKNHKSKAVTPEEEVGKATPLTPGERAFADDAKAKGKNWTDSQARLMFAKRNEAETQPNAQVATQPATNAPSRGKLTVNSTANDIKNASVEDIINLINSL